MARIRMREYEEPKSNWTILGADLMLLMLVYFVVQPFPAQEMVMPFPVTGFDVLEWIESENASDTRQQPEDQEASDQESPESPIQLSATDSIDLLKQSFDEPNEWPVTEPPVLIARKTTIWQKPQRRQTNQKPSPAVELRIRTGDVPNKVVCSLDGSDFTDARLISARLIETTGGDRSVEVAIAPDAFIPFRFFIQALDQCQIAGMRNIRLLLPQTPE